MRNFFYFLWETAKIVIIALLIVIPIRYFIFQPFFVKGQSMEPNFENGDYLIIDEISYRFNEPQRGDVVVFKYPNNLTQRYIKRIIGLPGEAIEIKEGEIVIKKDEEELMLNESNYLPGVYTSGHIFIVLGEDQFFVLGDNRSASSDSRVWGALPREDIIGRVFLRAWPFSTMAKFEQLSY